MRLFFRKTKDEGITILEILVAIAIMSILLASGISGLSEYRDTQVWNGEAAQAVATLQRAKSLTLASKSQLAYGVRVSEDRMTLFAAPTFATGTPTNEEYVFHPRVRASNISLANGGTDIIFDRLTGETPDFGSFRIERIGDATRYYTIDIKGTGIIEQK